MNIFKIAPDALALFPKAKMDANMWGPGSWLSGHVTKVVTTVATAVSLLTDLPTLVPVLQKLGKQHSAMGILPAHYDVVGQALIASLATALGDKFTDCVKNAYLKMWGVVKETMAKA